MSHHRKCFINNSLIEISFRAEEGLPLVSTNYMRLIIESYLARAQTMYPVIIVSIVVMANHLHLLVIVKNPSDIPNFIGYFKRETAYAVNKLLGRFKHTVWCDRYDSPIILDCKKALERLVYSYTNPQSARLENTIDKYPNLTTWQEFLSIESVCRKVPIFPRHAIPTLCANSTWSEEEDDRICKSILKEQVGEADLRIEPFAWLNCFSDTINTPKDAIVRDIVKEVRYRESSLDQEKGINVVGAKALREQDIRKAFMPKKRVRKMLCLASEVGKRVEYLGWIFNQAKEARESIKRWLNENITLSLPPGFFAPGGKITANIFPFSLEL